MTKYFIFAVALFLSCAPLSAEEGMYPLSELHNIDLQKAGFQISAADIFNPSAPSLSDAIVKLGGCTGSFISEDGLILTNHHCAFRAVQSASSAEHDFLKNGFMAANREKEIEAKGYTVRITQSFKDVSAQVLKNIDAIVDFSERNKTIKRRRKEITARAEKENPGMRAEVAEMFKGQTYVLFLYTYLKDVRLVYVPPLSIGNFGGETDNWEWPRHTGDFSIMRAYSAPDGSPAEYDANNIPFKPKTFLKVNARGVEENDFVFLLGYPGRTYRNRTSYFTEYEEELRMPFVVDWYRWQIDLLEKLGKKDRATALTFSATVKSLANTEKNYRGKLLGLGRLEMVRKKRDQEARILNFLQKDEQKKQRYGVILNKIKNLYAQKSASARRDFILSYLTRSVSALSFANTVYTAAEEREKEDLERESPYMNRNFERTQKRLFIRLQNFNREADKLILTELLRKAARLPRDQRIASLDHIFSLNKTEENWRPIIDHAYAASEITKKQFISKAFKQSFETIQKSTDPILRWIIALQSDLKALKEKSERQAGALSKLSAQWAEAKQVFEKSHFIPDANSTFRLTFGHIRGYAPADAVYNFPITTVKGILEKHTGRPPFNAPEKLRQLIKADDFGFLRSAKLKTLPVGILYDCDTTGGNSGSPVLNAKGELVGLNFDRAFGATINDFAWDESYSRSIGVDIRYILWILQKYAGAGYLLDEMGIEQY